MGVPCLPEDGPPPLRPRLAQYVTLGEGGLIPADVSSFLPTTASRSVGPPPRPGGGEAATEHAVCEEQQWLKHGVFRKSQMWGV